MKLYRINKVDRPNGRVLKKKDVLASNDQQALETARQSADCPTCEVLHAGEPIGLIT